MAADSQEMEIELLERKRAALMARTRILPTGESRARYIGRGLVGAAENAASLATGVPLMIAGEALAASAATGQPRAVSNQMTGRETPAMSPDQVAGRMAGYAYQPRTQAGQMIQEDMAQFMAPVGRGVEWLSKLGDNPTVQRVENAINPMARARDFIASSGDQPEFREHLAKGAMALAPIKLGAGAVARAPASASNAINTARQWGMAIDPSQVVAGQALGGMARRTAAVAGGKAAIPAAGSIRNQAIIQAKVAEDLGVRGTVTPEVLDNLTTQTNAAYTALENLKNANGQPYRINLSRQGPYKQDIRRLAHEARSEVTGEIPARVRTELQAYSKPQPGASVGGVMADIKQLRARARREYASQTSDGAEVGKALRGIADAMENEIARQVGGRSTLAPLVSEWQAARTLRAKVETVREAMKDTQIDAKSFADARRGGQFLSGNMATIADIADAMPHMVQSQARLGITQGLGVPDLAASLAVGGGAGFAGGGPAGALAGAAWPLGRLGARRYALSNPNVTRRATMPTAAVGAAAATQAQAIQPGESFGDFVRRRQAEMGTRQ